MIHLIKCFCQLKVDHINILTLFQLRDNVIMMGKELCAARPTRAESMLVFVYEIVFVKEAGQFVAYYFLKYPDEV